MAEDMNGNGPQDHDAAARILVLSQRTATLEGVVSDVRRELSNSVQGINNAIGAMSGKVEERFNALSATMAERNKTQWPVIWSAIGVSFAVLAYFMTQNLTPIKDRQEDMRQAIMTMSAETNRSIQALADKTVTREEMDWRSARGSEDRVRTDATIADLRSSMASRAEWSERNLSRDKELDTIRADAVRDMANVQRQIDQLRGDFTSFASSLGNGRDSFQVMRDEIRRLEERLDAWRMRRTDRMPTSSP